MLADTILKLAMQPDELRRSPKHHIIACLLNQRRFQREAGCVGDVGEMVLLCRQLDRVKESAGLMKVFSDAYRIAYGDSEVLTLERSPK